MGSKAIENAGIFTELMSTESGHVIESARSLPSVTAQQQ